MLIADKKAGDMLNAPKIIAIDSEIKINEARFVPMLVARANLKPYLLAFLMTNATTGPGVIINKTTAKIYANKISRFKKLPTKT